jgi:hypothetical protein
MINIKYKFCLTRLHEHLELDSYHISAISEGGSFGNIEAGGDDESVDLLVDDIDGTDESELRQIKTRVGEQTAQSCGIIPHNCDRQVSVVHSVNSMHSTGNLTHSGDNSWGYVMVDSVDCVHSFRYLANSCHNRGGSYSVGNRVYCVKSISSSYHRYSRFIMMDQLSYYSRHSRVNSNWSSIQSSDGVKSAEKGGLVGGIASSHDCILIIFVISGGGYSRDNSSSGSRSIERDSNRSCNAVICHLGLEAVDRVSGVGNGTDTAVRVSHAVGAGDHVSVPTLLPGFRVASQGISYRVTKVVLGVGVESFLVTGVGSTHNSHLISSMGH